ncbi:MAG TPA: AAA family ATPase, partial [Thermoanaerobaculia bacterium]|nr:AAA family ATPase [Thermoanaerobaculia bacterium]
LAEPGAVLASETTARLLDSSFKVEALEPAYVKGKAEPVRAFRVLGRSGNGNGGNEQAVLSEVALTPFVGRRRELAVLEELREQAASGEGQLVGITGEAGSGKSRLLHEFRKQFWGDGEGGQAYLAGRCLSYGAGLPYHPFLHLLRNAWGLGEAETADSLEDKIRSGLRADGIDSEEPLPFLIQLLGGRDGSGQLDDLSAQGLKNRTFAALRQVLLGMGQGRLVLLEIEDLHWADETSEELLSYLAEGAARAPVLLLATYRSGYRPTWLDKSYATQIAMRRLTAEQSRAVIESVLPPECPLPAEVAEAILEKAEGNPFFLEELARSLAERTRGEEMSVPDTVQGVLMGRIDRLPEEHKRLLQTASVLGREFSLDLLNALWDQPDRLSPLLADLKRWEFLYEALAEGTENRTTYLFKHALIQEVAYQSLLIVRRQDLHAAAARALEALHGERLEDVYEDLVYHYPKSGDSPQAVHYLMAFAERAARVYAHAEAARALREALFLSVELPETERDRRTVEILVQLAESLLPLAQLPETLDFFQRNRCRAERLGDPALLGRFYFWLAHTHSYLGHQEEAIQVAHLAITAAGEAGDDATMGKAYYVLSRDGFWSGKFADGIQYSSKAIELLERSGGWWWQGQAYWVAGFNHYALGRFPAAFEAMDRANTIWETLQDPRLDPSWSTGYFHASLGEWDQGIAACLGGLERARDPLNTAAALGFLGYAYLEKGDLPQAEKALEDSIQRLAKAGMKQLLGWFSAYLAKIRLAQGRVKEARALASQGLTAAQETEFQYGAGLAHRTLGRVAQAEGRPSEALEQMEEALATFEALQVPFEAARTRLALANLAHSQGDRRRATRELLFAYEDFIRLDVPHYIRCAEQQAARYGVALPVSSGPLPKA